LENFDFFKDLDEKTAKDIKSKSKYVEIPKGTILFYEGDICKDVLYLVEGNIKLFVSANTNNEIPLYDFCQGNSVL